MFLPSVSKKADVFHFNYYYHTTIKHKLVSKPQAWKMAQPAKVPTITFNNLSLMPRIQMLKGETTSSTCPNTFTKYTIVCGHPPN